MQIVQSKNMRCDSRGTYSVNVVVIKDADHRTVAEIAGHQMSVERRVWDIKTIGILEEAIAFFKKAQEGA